MSESVDCDLGFPLCKKNGRNFNLLYVFNFAEVVQIVVDARLVQTWKHIQPSGVVMISMDAEDGQLYCQRRIQIVRLVILKGLEVHLLLAKNMLIKDFWGFITIQN